MSLTIDDIRQQMGDAIDALHDESMYRLDMIHKNSTENDYRINMTASIIFSGLAKVLMKVRKELPVEYSLATKRDLSPSEGDPQPS